MTPKRAGACDTAYDTEGTVYDTEGTAYDTEGTAYDTACNPTRDTPLIHEQPRIARDVVPGDSSSPGRLKVPGGSILGGQNTLNRL